MTRGRFRPQSDQPLRSLRSRGAAHPFAFLAVLTYAGFALACAPVDDADPESSQEPGAEATSPLLTESADRSVRPARIDNELTAGDTIPGHPSWTEQDWTVLEETLRWALDTRVDTLPVGERIARIGEQYLGTAYIPQTLDPPGEERLVINLRGLDCVTYVEGMVTLAHLVRAVPSGQLLDRDRILPVYEGILTSLRYRDGRIAGYPSRLHYFSEWVQENDRRGWVRDVTRELGGERDPEAPRFMTAHPDAYHQLADPATLEAIRAVEEELAVRTRYVIPETRLPEVASGIRTGDVIAATSTLEGLDVAHTGIAVWKGDVLHLMHAPLVGDSVQLSEIPLTERLLGITSQDGVIVARPLERPGISPN